MNKTQKKEFDKDPEAFVDALLEKQKNALSDLTTKHAAALTELTEQKDGEITDLITKHGTEIQSLENEMNELRDFAADVNKEVSGTFTVSGNEYRFKQGFLRTRLTARLIPAGNTDLLGKMDQIIDSADLIADKKWQPVLDNLVAIKYGGIELANED